MGTVCPQACLTKLKDADFARLPLENQADKQAECGKEGKTVLPEYLSGDYRYEQGDMYYALKKISWSGWAHGTVSCGEGQVYTSNGQEMCCCECSADLCFHATVTDEYDFCSSLKEDAPEFSLPWCGCVIEKAQEFLSLAGTTIGKPFDIECFWAEETGVSFTHCEEV